MIKIKKPDLEWAHEKGLLNAEQIDPLWLALEAKLGLKFRFDLINVTYYFGAFLIIFAMGFFLTKALYYPNAMYLFGSTTSYVIILSYFAYYLFHKQKLEIAGGVVAVVAVFLVPLAIIGFQKMTGFWPSVDLEEYANYNIWLKGSQSLLAIGTIIVAVIMFCFMKTALLSVPILVSLWYMFMELTPLLFGKDNFTPDEQGPISFIFGAVVLVISYFWDRRTELDFAFWGYLFGMLTFLAEFFPMRNHSEFVMFLYFCFSIALIFISVLLQRVIFIICGAIGCIGYLYHLATTIFENSPSFSIFASLVGLGFIGVGVQYQRNKKLIDEKMIILLPKFLSKLSPTNRVK